MKHTRRFSASFRPNLTHYINQELLDGLVLLSTLSYQTPQERLQRLKRLDQHLSALKILVRQAHMQEALDHNKYDLHAKSLHALGRMIGGWQRHLEQIK